MNETISINEFKIRLIELCSRSGLSGLPRRTRDRHIVLKSVILTLERTREYSEGEINLELRSWLKGVENRIGLDHVDLRRRLIDHEYLGRSKDGSRYWVAVSSRKQMEFDSEIENADVSLIIQQGKQIILEKKRRYLSLNKTLFVSSS